jgi:hypothetical protein
VRLRRLSGFWIRTDGGPATGGGPELDLVGTHDGEGFHQPLEGRRMRLPDPILLDVTQRPHAEAAAPGHIHLAEPGTGPSPAQQSAKTLGLLGHRSSNLRQASPTNSDEPECFTRSIPSGSLCLR